MNFHFVSRYTFTSFLLNTIEDKPFRRKSSFPFFPSPFFFLKTEIQSLSEFHFDQHFSLFGILSYFKKKKKKESNNKMNEILRGKKEIDFFSDFSCNQFIIFFRMHVDSLELIMETLLKLQNFPTT